MIISDLQHIESAIENEVQGGCKCHKGWWAGPNVPDDCDKDENDVILPFQIDPNIKGRNEGVVIPIRK